METRKNVTGEHGADILFSKSVKAGQRIYYIDGKKNHKGDMYLSITESKRIFNDPQDITQVSYEKHKIFLFREQLLLLNLFLQHTCLICLIRCRIVITAG